MFVYPRQFFICHFSGNTIPALLAGKQAQAASFAAVAFCQGLGSPSKDVWADGEKKERVVQKKRKGMRKKRAWLPRKALVNISHNSQDFDLIPPCFQALRQAPIST